MIDNLIGSGAIAYVAIAIIVLEVIVFGLSGRFGWRSLIANGLSGVFLLLAFRGAVLGYTTTTLAVLLMLGFLSHAADVAVRLRGG